MFEALPGGHAVLLACGYPAGRTALVRLVTHLADYKVFLFPGNYLVALSSTLRVIPIITLLNTSSVL